MISKSNNASGNNISNFRLSYSHFLVKRGDSHYAHERFHAALHDYKLAFKQNSDNLEARLGIETTLYALARRNDPQISYDTLLNHDPNDSNVYGDSSSDRRDPRKSVF